MQEMEQELKDLLQVPYNNGTISIETDSIEIRRICEYESGSTERLLVH